VTVGLLVKEDVGVLVALLARDDKVGFNVVTSVGAPLGKVSLTTELFLKRDVGASLTGSISDGRENG
jgi:hypothetical protein